MFIARSAHAHPITSQPNATKAGRSDPDSGEAEEELEDAEGDADGEREEERPDEEALQRVGLLLRRPVLGWHNPVVGPWCPGSD